MKEFLYEIANLKGDFTNNILCITSGNIKIVSEIVDYRLINNGDIVAVLENNLGVFILNENLEAFKRPEDWLRHFKYEFRNKEGELIAWIGKRKDI